jgi:Ca-activated chloride channel family protein
MIELELVPQRAALLVGQDNTLDVLMRAKAPSAPQTQRERLPLNLAIVIDRSGSMSGRPLAEAKRCATMIIDGLSANDHASVVVYSDDTDVLVPSRPVGDKELFRRAINAVTSRGSTALHSGWLTGAEQAARKPNGRALSRVLLLSDGCANRGVCDTPYIATHCADMAEAGVGTSTYGLGRNFNEELMVAMAHAGQGNAYYGQTAEDLMDPFREEFDLMSALYARRLRLALEPTDGVQVEVINLYRNDGLGRSILPDLAYDGEAWALLRLTVPRFVLEAGGDGDIHLLTANLAFTDVDGLGQQSAPVHLRLPRLPVQAFSAVTTNELVMRRGAELAAAALQEEGRLAAGTGDWNRVRDVLGALRALSKGNAWLSASVAELEQYAQRHETQHFSKEAYYMAQKMRNRLVSRYDEAVWSADLERIKPSYLRRKLEQGKGIDGPENDSR